MTAVVIGSHEAGSPEWHATRAQGIGGSDIAAVVGLSPWMSPFELWHRKKGHLSEIAENDYMAWGKRLEDPIADAFHERHPEICHLGTAGTYASVERPWQLANVDRFLCLENYMGEETSHATAENPHGVLEIKTSRYPDGWGQSGSDQIPLHYLCQVQWYMDVLDLPFAYVAVLIGGSEYREYVIDADPDDQLALRDAAAAFWWSLQTDDEPPLDASESTYQAVRSLHPEISGEDTTIDPALYAAYLLSEGKAEEWERTHRETKSRVLAAMGDARRGLVNGTAVFRRQPNRNGVSLYHIGESA